MHAVLCTQHYTPRHHTDAINLVLALSNTLTMCGLILGGRSPHEGSQSPFIVSPQGLEAEHLLGSINIVVVQDVGNGIVAVRTPPSPGRP